MSFKDIKLVVIDIDGTLLDSERRLQLETILAIEAVQKKGIIVTLASGRTFVSASTFAKLLNIDAPIIAYNGAYIARISDPEPLVQTPIDIRIAKPLLGQLEAGGYYVKVYIDNELYVQVVTEETIAFSKYHGVPYKGVGVGNLSSLTRDPHKIVIIDEPKVITEVFQLLEPWHTQFNICRDSDRGIEIVRSKVSKGSALDKVCQILDIKKSQVMAFGNEGNDLEMIKEVGVGVAMGNAFTLLKKHAKIVTKSNDDLGVAHALNKYILRKEI